MTTQTINIELPPLYRLQKQALYSPARYSATEGSTKSGKTHGCLIWQIHQVFERGGVHWWVAPIYKQAKIAYERAKGYIPRALYTSNDSDLEIRIEVGGNVYARWQFKTAEKPDGLYGEDVESAVIDEASRIREASFHAVRSTLTATQGPIRLIGNVKGRGNWFYKLCRRAESGEKGYSYHKLTAQDAVDAGVFPQAELDDAERALPHHVFRELYFCEPADDGGNPFGLSALKACLAPMSTDAPVVWGWDVAKSQDWTVGIGLDAHGVVCAIERWQLKPWAYTIEQIAQRATVPTLIDSTGVGDPVVEEVQRQARGHVEGFKFTSASKQQLMERLAVAIQSQETAFPDGVLYRELETFEYEYTRTGVKYSAPEGLHDDCVCAYALANLHYEQRYKRRRKVRSRRVITGASVNY